MIMSPLSVGLESKHTWGICRRGRCRRGRKGLLNPRNKDPVSDHTARLTESLPIATEAVEALIGFLGAFGGERFDPMRPT